MSRVVANSLPDAIPAILTVLAQEATVEVWIPPLLCGYWAQIKPSTIPPSEMTPLEFKRELRRHTRPQPYDVQLVEWPAFMYRGYHAGHSSSAL